MHGKSYESTCFIVSDIVYTHHQFPDTVVGLDNSTLKYCDQLSAVLPLVAAEEGSKEATVDLESDTLAL